MKCTQKDAEKFSIPGGSEGFLYPSHPKGEQSIALVEMSGEYPMNSYSVNDRCTETMFMIEGSFEAEVNGEKITISQNDELMILPGQKYRLVGTGKSLVIITPAWDKSQNHIIPK